MRTSPRSGLSPAMEEKRNQRKGYVYAIYMYDVSVAWTNAMTYVPCQALPVCMFIMQVQWANPDRVIHRCITSQTPKGLTQLRTPPRISNDAGDATQCTSYHRAMKEEKPSALATGTPHVLPHVWTAPMGGVCSSTATGTDTICHTCSR